MAPFPTLADPRLLVRVVDQVAAGNRRARGLAEVLDVEVRLVDQSLRAARWLGFLKPGDDLALSDDGLRLEYAGSRRARVYAEVVRAHPFLGPLLPLVGPIDMDGMTAAVRGVDPALTPVTARRRAGVLRRLAEPGVKTRAAPRTGLQLGLSFGTSPPPGRAQVDLRAEIGRAHV